MNLINNAALAAVRQEYPLPSTAGLCLAAARTVVEHGLGWPSHDFYSRVVTYRAAFNQATNDKYAADAEESFRRRGWAPLDNPRPGDLVFSRIPSPQGHVGVVFAAPDGKLYVLENTAYNRGQVLYGAIRVTPIEKWDAISGIGRFPAEMIALPAPTPMPLPPLPTSQQVRIFSAGSNKQVTTGTLVEGKLYIRPEFLDPRYR